MKCESFLVELNISEGIIIEPGVHSFSFSYLIPFECPSSVETFNGRIRYWIQITLKRPFKFDQIYTRGFTVINMRNFNLEEDGTWQVGISITKAYSIRNFYIQNYNKWE